MKEIFNIKRVIEFLEKQELGKIGESLATLFLESLEYKIIERNFRCKQGEIDIIAKDKNEFVFIEVKTRSSFKFGLPSEAVNSIKQKHIYNSTKYYLYLHHLENQYIRFDVIEVLFKNNKFLVSHLKNVDIIDKNF